MVKYNIIKTMSNKIIKFYLLSMLLAVFCTACTADSYQFTYTFKNETQYTIYIKVGSDYEIKGNDTTVTIGKNTRITLPGNNLPGTNNAVSIYVVGVSPLDFTWTAESEMDNAKIYAAVAGDSVTFREL